METIRRFHWSRKKLRSAVKLFSLSVGAAVLVLLSSTGGWDASGNRALEASAFNQNRTSLPVAAAETKPVRRVIPLGSAFGIKLFTDGVIVASLADVYTENGLCCPASQAGIRPGDYLLKADGETLQNNSSLARIIGRSEGKKILLQVRREDHIFETGVLPVYSDGAYKTGMWIRDSAAGIGTLTFYDPEAGIFAGLGHGICDLDTAGVMALKTGEPAEISLCGIVRGERNEPGRLQGYFSSDQSLGVLLRNNETGVYGTLKEPPGGQTVEVLPAEQVEPGPVQILSSIDGDGPKLYDAVLEKVGAPEQKTKNLRLRITDPVLLNRTGGIVQGMSGCPILQRGKLAGAVTHVLTEDPALGFGIFAETMCEQTVELGLSKKPRS